MGCNGQLCMYVLSIHCSRIPDRRLCAGFFFRKPNPNSSWLSWLSRLCIIQKSWCLDELRNNVRRQPTIFYLSSAATYLFDVISDSNNTFLTFPISQWDMNPTVGSTPVSFGGWDYFVCNPIDWISLLTWVQKLIRLLGLTFLPINSI